MNRCRRARRGRGDLGRHVVRIGELLVVQVAAFLRQQLVLDVHRGGAGVLEAAHHVHDVERLAVAGVAVHQQRQAGRAGDLADEEAHLVDGDHAEVGQAHRRGHRGTGEIQRLEPGRLGLQRGLAVVRAGHLQDARPGEQRPEALAGGGGRQVGGDKVGHGDELRAGGDGLAEGTAEGQCDALSEDRANPPAAATAGRQAT